MLGLQDRAVYGQPVTYLGAGELYRACSRQLAAALDGVRPCPSRGSLLKSARAIQAALDCWCAVSSNCLFQTVTTTRTKFAIHAALAFLSQSFSRSVW